MVSRYSLSFSITDFFFFLPSDHFTLGEAFGKFAKEVLRAFILERVIIGNRLSDRSDFKSFR